MRDARTGPVPNLVRRPGPLRLLLTAYALFALAATARAGVQLATKASDAPLAYALSAFAGVVYLVATFALARDLRRTALVAVSIELAGVLTVGSINLDDSVWSGYGAGYGHVPLILPVLGLAWLSRSPAWRPGTTSAASR